MEKYSCWSWTYSKRYLITHPWQWFKCLWRNIKDVCMRARYGFCWSDVWNWDSWFLHVAPNMLRHMADYGSAYPGHKPFETPEKWHDWLHEMADLLETGNEEWQDAHNEYREEFIKHLKDDWGPTMFDEDGNIRHTPKEPSELSKKYRARSEELAKQGEDNVRRVMSLLGEHFYDLWD